jgi:ATP-dependent RNA helicase RhlE
MSFDTLGLSAGILRAVADEGYSIPTPAQSQAIPAILQGRDVMVRAQTGTGKTAAFALPMLERLSSGASRRSDRRAVRALVLTPTRELACQVEEAIRTYGRNLPLKAGVVYGGVGIGPQIGQLRRGIDILVATPGRLLDHTTRRTLDLSRVEILVLDEADRMLDMGFLPDVRKILAMLPKDRQNLLLSASFPEPLRKLAEAMMDSPARIDVSRRTSVADGVSQVVHPVAREGKSALLSFLIRSRKWDRVLVFTRTKRGADRLSRHLHQDGIAAAAIHSDKSQSQRTRVLGDFKRSVVRVLVATDVAARGLDIDELPHVVNFELPHVPEDYVHRVGRTGRAGNEGRAVSLVSTEERDLLRSIERLIQQDIPKEVISDRESRLPAATEPHREPPQPARPAHPGAPRRRSPWFERRSASRPRKGRRAHDKGAGNR